jgi:hypothetical protein
VALYSSVAARVRLLPALVGDPWNNTLARFLTRRCSDEFLKLWASQNSDDLSGLLDFEHLMGVSWRPTVLARLQAAGALPAKLRENAAELLKRKAIEDFDGAWLDSNIIELFMPDERQGLLDKFREDLLPRIDDLVYESASGYSSDVSPENRYDSARETVTAYLGAFGGDSKIGRKLQATLDGIDSWVAEAEAEENFRPKPSNSFAPAQHFPSLTSGRDQFDDVHVGH